MILRCFVIIPYHDRSNKIFEAITRCAPAPDYEVQFLRADTSPMLQLELESNVRSHLELCDFTIADVSEGNPNVFFEVGYAIGLRKPVIFLINKEGQLPSNLRGRYSLRYDERDLGQLTSSLPAFIRAAVEAVQTTTKADSFLATAYNTPISSDILLAIKNARERIDILTTNLEPIFSIGIASEVDAVLQKSKIRVRILTLDPDSPVVNMRAQQLGLPVAPYRMELRKSIQESLSLFSKHSELCQIRLYDEVPYQILYVIDNHIYMSLITPPLGSRHTLTFKLKVNDPGIQSLVANFARIWSRAMPTQGYHGKEYKIE